MIVKVEPLDRERLDGIRRDLEAYEAHYGVPSAEMASAFTHRGRLRETEDYRRWSFLWEIWRRVSPAFL
jgi:hypothetical protein